MKQMIINVQSYSQKLTPLATGHTPNNLVHVLIMSSRNQRGSLYNRNLPENVPHEPMLTVFTTQAAGPSTSASGDIEGTSSAAEAAPLFRPSVVREIQ